MLTKFEAVRNLADLVQRIKHANSMCPHEYEYEVKKLEYHISLIETELEEIIDNLMAARYANHNKKTANQREDPATGLLGRWGLNNWKRLKANEQTD